MTTAEDLAAALEEPIGEGCISLFDGSVSLVTGQLIQITLESGELFSVTVESAVCRYPSCGADVTRIVDGQQLCGEHGSEFSDFIQRERR